MDSNAKVIPPASGWTSIPSQGFGLQPKTDGVKANDALAVELFKRK